MFKINPLAALGLVNPPTEEPRLADSLPQQIAIAGGQRRYRNAADAETSEMHRRYINERKQRRRITSVAGMVAADRMALYRTIEFIEKRWREGGEVDQTMNEANQVRREEFDRMVSDYEMTDKFKEAIEDLPDEVTEVRRVLVENRPIQQRSPSPPRRPKR